MTRNEKLLFSIDPATQSGIEIGPLDKPVVTRDIGPIRYVDYLSTKELQARYADDPSVDTDRIMQVDYVLGSNTLAQAIGDMAPVDYVVASHIIEHTPDMIGWMKEIHAILRPGGVLSLAIPDKRYTFDFARSVTRPADVIEAYLHGYRKPSIRQIFDFVSSAVKVDAAQAWAGEIEENELEKLPAWQLPGPATPAHREGPSIFLRFSLPRDHSPT